MDYKYKFKKLYEKYMYVVGFCGHGLFILQAIKMFSTRSALGVSLPGFIIACISLASWLFYGILKQDKVLVYVNVVGLLSALLCVFAITIFS